jgi:hypothetical protein
VLLNQPTCRLNVEANWGAECWQVKSKADQMQSRLEDALAAKNQEMDRLMKELDRERTKGPSMMMESLVSKLKVQLAGKDKKLSQLKEAIRQVGTDPRASDGSDSSARR